MIKSFETTPRNGSMPFKQVINAFAKVGYDILTVRLYDAPNGETFGHYTCWCKTLRSDEPQPIIRVEYDTDTRELLIITC